MRDSSDELRESHPPYQPKPALDTIVISHFSSLDLLQSPAIYILFPYGINIID